VPHRDDGGGQAGKTIFPRVSPSTIEKTRAGLERLVRTGLGRQLALRLRPARDLRPQTGGPAQLDERGSDPARSRRDYDVVGEGSLVLLGEQGAPGVERLGVSDDGVDHGFTSVLQHAGSVAPEVHRELVVLDPDTSRRPHVVHVEAGGPDRDLAPTVRVVRVRCARVDGNIGMRAAPTGEGND
jgi:hypothetical protein